MMKISSFLPICMLYTLIYTMSTLRALLLSLNMCLQIVQEKNVFLGPKGLDLNVQYMTL
jgi:hypothetical protein